MANTKQELFKVDQNVYSFRWEIDPQEILDSMPGIVEEVKKVQFVNGTETFTNGVTESPAVRFLDLRTSADFGAGHVKGAFNAHLPGLTAETITPFNFDEINTLVEQSKGLERLLEDENVSDWVFKEGPPLVVVDYNGDTSRILVASLRAKGVEAYTFIDGVPGLLKYLQSLNS